MFTTIYSFGCWLVKQERQERVMLATLTVDLMIAIIVVGAWLLKVLG